uniref:Uncharacterized protein n=1 Tax=Eutreptiella gymnastica TaxID=73025 RepID=A0A7S4GF95_9EUGL
MHRTWHLRNLIWNSSGNLIWNSSGNLIWKSAICVKLVWTASDESDVVLLWITSLCSDLKYSSLLPVHLRSLGFDVLDCAQVLRSVIHDNHLVPRIILYRMVKLF